MRKGHFFKDSICPDSLEFKKDHFVMGGKFGRVLFLKEYASYIKDSMINELTAGDQFLKRPGVTPVCTHQLRVPAYEQIRVLKVEPGRVPEEVTMPNTLRALQEAVGGDIDLLDLDIDATLVCNEDGKAMGLPANRRVGCDIIAGTFLIVGAADSECCSLSDNATAHYAERFAEPVSEPCPEGLKEFTFYIM